MSSYPVVIAVVDHYPSLVHHSTIAAGYELMLSLNALRPLILGLVAATAVYFGVRMVAQQPIVTPMVTAEVSPVPSKVPSKVSRSAKVGVTMVAPSLSPSKTPMITPFTLSEHVVMSEIAWMGTASSSTDEWIELYNAGTTDISLAGWRLKADDGKPNITLAGTIRSRGYYLIGRSGSLSNTGENLKLFNATGLISDQVDCAGGWYAGMNKTAATRAPMIRVDPAKPGNDPMNWKTAP